MDSSKVKASRVASNGMRMPSVIQQLMTQSEASIGLRCQASTNHRITLQHVEVTKGTPSLIGTTGRSCSYVAQILSIVGWPMEWRIWHRTGGSASPLKVPASWEPHEDFWENKLRCLGGSVSSPVSEASSTMRSKGHCDRGRSTKAFQCLWCKWRVSLQRTKTPRDCWVQRTPDNQRPHLEKKCWTSTVNKSLTTVSVGRNSRFSSFIAVSLYLTFLAITLYTGWFSLRGPRLPESARVSAGGSLTDGAEVFTHTQTRLRRGKGTVAG